MFALLPSAIHGCYELRPKVAEDVRGRFVKVFHEPTFASHGLETHFPEEYYSVSTQGVIRGMHFQLPPHDHVKLVYVVQGAIFDVVLDLRVGSPTYGCTASFELDAQIANMAYVPKGLAHGFCVRSSSAIAIYRVSTVYSPEHDVGVLWNSIPASWPTKHPILSERDQTFPVLDSIKSPFTFE
jgi:dTDP-4-dehydrorhamnose 3,5-epimerase